LETEFNKFSNQHATVVKKSCSTLLGQNAPYMHNFQKIVSTIIALHYWVVNKKA